MAATDSQSFRFRRRAQRDFWIACLNGSDLSCIDALRTFPREANLPIADNCPKGRIPSRNVTRDDLAIAVGKSTPALSRAAASDLVDQLFSEIETGLRTDRIVSLQGFGVFKISLEGGASGKKSPFKFRRHLSHSGARSRFLQGLANPTPRG